MFFFFHSMLSVKYHVSSVSHLFGIVAITIINKTCFQICLLPDQICRCKPQNHQKEENVVQRRYAWNFFRRILMM